MKKHLETAWPETGRAPYKLKTQWRLTEADMTTPQGESMTVPDDSYTIKDLIRKYAGHIDPAISKLGEFNGEEEEVDFDDIDYNELKHADLVDQMEARERAIERKRELAQKMSDRKQKAVDDEVKKLASQKMTDQGNDDDDEERTGGENTRRSRKYEKPNSGESPKSKDASPS